RGSCNRLLSRRLTPVRLCDLTFYHWSLCRNTSGRIRVKERIRSGRRPAVLLWGSLSARVLLLVEFFCFDSTVVLCCVSSQRPGLECSAFPLVPCMHASIYVSNRTNDLPGVAFLESALGRRACLPGDGRPSVAPPVGCSANAQ
ncbi:hypothetical protein BIW11_08984, partial [Tropilaelaps mercedesae]